MSDLKDILELADLAFIIKHQAEINVVEHISYSTAIYSDGKFSTKINKDTGYIIIYDIINASYLVYLDKNQKVVLYIFEYISTALIKNVIDAITDAKKQIQLVDSLSNTNIETNTSTNDLDSINYHQFKTDNEIYRKILHNANLIDINNMVCDECNQSNFKTPVLCDDNRTIEFQCKNCYTIYRLKPSKFYVLDSKTVFINNDDMIAHNPSSKLYQQQQITDTPKGDDENNEPI